MQNDLISRSELLELFDERLDGAHIQVATRRTGKTLWSGIYTGVNWGRNTVIEAPAVDAVVLPEGRPGDYLEWEIGIIGHTTIQPIKAILICEDCVRYDLGVFAPTVDHENIVRIMSREEASREIERRGNDGKL